MIRIFFKYIQNLIPTLFLSVVLLFALGVTPSAEVQAQDTKYEKIQKQKNKANRRLKRRGDKAKKARNDYRKFKKRSRQGDRAYQGDITGRKVRGRINPSRKSRASYPKVNPYAGRKRTSEASRAKAFNRTIRYSTKKRERAWKGNISGNKLRDKGFRSKKTNIKSPRTPLSSRRKGERDGAKMSGQGFKGLRSISRSSERAQKRKRIVPRSASGNYRVRKREKPYAFREKSKWESAFQGDITGRKLRKKGTTDRPSIKKPTQPKYSNGRGRRGDRAYKGTITGGYKSISSGKERAWKNNISGHKLRAPKARRSSENAGRKPIGVTPPGPGAERAIRYQGNIKSRKPLKGAGGSISGRRWNNNGKAIQGRGVKSQDLRTSKFQGNIKGGKPLKGGGSISGGNWNNNGKAIQGRGYRDQDQRIAKFQGNIKRGKQQKGGGSISGGRWNNNGKAIQGRGIKSQDQKIAGFSGNIKSWKYKTGPLPEHQYTGDFKRARRVKNPNAAKGALKVQNRGRSDRAMTKYSGDIKNYKFKTGPLDQHKYTGNIKRKRPVKNPNAADESLKVRDLGKRDRSMTKFSGNFKRKGTYKRNPSATDESLLTRVPSAATSKATRFQGRYRLTSNYKKRKNTADGALRGIGPSKAAISASNYQGNIKMKKGSLGRKHPSFKYDQPRNTAFEKTKFSFKLFWSKLFKKSENQPENLKRKEGKPRYDKKEKDLWND